MNISNKGKADCDSEKECLQKTLKEMVEKELAPNILDS